MNINYCFVLVVLRFSKIHANILRSLPLETIQYFNLRMLNNSLQIGWNHFCNADIDEEVMSFYPEFSPSSVEILLWNETNQSVSLSVKDLSQLSEFGFEANKKTLLIISGVSDPRTLDVRTNLQFLQQKLTNFNVIVVDFGANILQIYNTVKQSVQLNSFLVSKILEELRKVGMDMETITLIGHSVGANIAALAADIFTQQSKGTRKLPLLIALDPALMCSKEEIYVNPTVCRQVVVIHGENSVLGVREHIGTIDIYPNGDERSFQPGCSSSLCSHMYPLMLFIRTLIDETEVFAIKCRDWSSFRRGKCNFKDSLKIGLDYDTHLWGKYYSLAGKYPAYENDSRPKNQVELVPISLDAFASSHLQPNILK